MVIATYRASWSAAFEMTGIAIEKVQAIRELMENGFKRPPVRQRGHSQTGIRT